MKRRATFITGAAIGYVLGTRAGRERYEQIKGLAQRATGSPAVQEATDTVKARAGELAGTARDTLSGKLGDRVPGLRRSPDQDDSIPPQRETTPAH